MTGSPGKGPRVVVVRPYPTRLRDQMWDVLRGVGLAMDEAEIIPSGTTDQDAVAQVHALDPDILLVPFNAHRGPDGERVDGLSFCRRLAQATEGFRTPVVMPVSRMAMANLRLQSSSGEHAALIRELLDQRILAMEAEGLGEPDAQERVVMHLRRHGIRVFATRHPRP